MKPWSDSWSVPTAFVAPHAGAWIETPPAQPVQGASVSPPTRGRGLKLFDTKKRKSRGKSPPTRGRGLKLQVLVHGVGRAWSPPTRGRGLKPG